MWNGTSPPGSTELGPPLGGCPHRSDAGLWLRRWRPAGCRMRRRPVLRWNPVRRRGGEAWPSGRVGDSRPPSASPPTARREGAGRRRVRSRCGSFFGVQNIESGGNHPFQLPSSSPSLRRGTTLRQAPRLFARRRLGPLARSHALAGRYPTTCRAPGRIRTCDLGIRSPLLCPLSYGGGETSLGTAERLRGEAAGAQAEASPPCRNDETHTAEMSGYVLSSQRARSWRAMTSFWISLVPSPMIISGTSR